MKTNPLVTVLMPVYNGEKYLQEAIDSMLNQTFKEFEFLIINDGSTDSSESIICSYADNRIRYIKNEANLKLISTLNKGIDMARGKYIVRMDADDISMPQRIAKQVAFMETNRNVVVAGTWYENIGAQVGVVRYPTSNNQVKAALLYSCPICHPSVIWRVDETTEYYDSNFLHAEDYELWTRLIQKGQIVNIAEVLVKYRIHQQSISRTNVFTQDQNSKRVREIQFKTMGIALTPAEIELYAEFCYANWTYFRSVKRVEDTGRLIEKIFSANSVSQYLPIAFYQNYILEKWFHLNYNCGSEKLFYGLSIAGQLHFKDKLKLKIKSILQ